MNSDTNIDHQDLLNAQGAFTEDGFTALDHQAYQLWLEERYRDIDPQQESQDELHDYLVEQEEPLTMEEEQQRLEALEGEYWDRKRDERDGF